MKTHVNTQVIDDATLRDCALAAGLRFGYLTQGDNSDAELRIETREGAVLNTVFIRHLAGKAYDAGKADAMAAREEFMRSEISAAWRDAITERRRQVEVEGFTDKHDDQYAKSEISELTRVAACYAIGTRELRFYKYTRGATSGGCWADLWPAHWLGWWKPKNRRYDLIRAIALLVAEVERMDRATERGGK